MKSITIYRTIKRKCKGNAVTLTLLLLLVSLTARAQWDFSTDYFKIRINNKGFITSMKNITVKPNPEFSPVDKPSPLMSLYDSRKKFITSHIKQNIISLKKQLPKLS